MPIRNSRGDVHGVVLWLAAAAIALWPQAQLLGQSEAEEASVTSAQGLRGYYFVGEPQDETFRLDDYGIPIPTGEPAASRLDSRIAFGHGQGFDRSRGQVEWYAHPRTGAVIWQGYLRMPKAGTYYLATASDDGSAVYVHDARVALNGQFGGWIPSEHFAYPDAGIEQTSNANENTYVVPIVVSRPGVLPIEVRYAMRNIGSTGFGIDLYWVTPDSPRGADDKRIAEIVPSEALLPEDPEEQPAASTSAARSTLQSDYLYFPLGIEDHATLRVRVVDVAGQPLSGRRVHISTLSSYGPRMTVTQPEPTDEDGWANARVELPSQIVSHTSKFFATVLDDFVDVGQMTEIVVAPSRGITFLPPAYSPYYDPRTFRIAPEPLVVGRPATITVPLTNRQDVPYSLYVSVLAQESNIGGIDWNPLGASEPVLLQPGESSQVSVTWSPERSLAHICFQVIVWGNVADSAAGAWQVLGIATAEAAGPPQPLESRQQNAGAVSDFLDWLNDEIEGIYEAAAPLDVRSGRYSVGGEVATVSVGGEEVGSISAEGSFGATEGSDPTKDIVSGRWSFGISWFGGGKKEISGEVGVRISDEVQQRVSSPYGGLGSKTGAAVRRMPGCDPQFREQC